MKKRNYLDWCEVENAKYIHTNLPENIKNNLNTETILLLLHKQHHFKTSRWVTDDDMEKANLAAFLSDVGNNLYPSLIEFLHKLEINLTSENLDLIFKVSEDYTNSFDWSEFEEEEESEI